MNVCRKPWKSANLPCESTYFRKSLSSRDSRSVTEFDSLIQNSRAEARSRSIILAVLRSVPQVLAETGKRISSALGFFLTTHDLNCDTTSGCKNCTSSRRRLEYEAANRPVAGPALRHQAHHANLHPRRSRRTSRGDQGPAGVG